ncbi:MAG: heparinase II/III family protein [Hyphomicrobiaceae bacterium]
MPPTLTLTERSRLARIAVNRTRRSLVARALRSPVIKWRYGAPTAEELLIVPQELRTADPSFAEELAQGQLGLGGAVASIGDGSMFDVIAPSEIWSRSLHGFGWLRNLSAAGSDDDREMALEAILTWIDRYPPRSGGIPWQPDVVGRRIQSWLANVPFVFEGIDSQTYDRIADSLGLQLVQLATRWRDAPDGYPRLEALIGLLVGSMCIAGRDNNVFEFEHALANEVQTQVLEDGGHISRNAVIAIELLLDLLPLQTCFAARERKFHPALAAAVARMLKFLRYIRLGDGSLTRFNGMGATPFDSLATLLAYDPAPESNLAGAPKSGYARLEAGNMVLIADVGTPPALEYAGAACAGALSFELSIGDQAVFVNAGSPGPADQDWLATSRSTASHNTLCLNTTSSSKLLRNKLLNRLVRASPIRYPNKVTSELNKQRDGSLLKCSHDGYVRKFSLTHKRELFIERNGMRLSGEDIIGAGTGSVRFARDLPYAIHFHLDSDVLCRHDDDPAIAILELRDGTVWHFTVHGTTMSIEDSINFADLAGPTRSWQIVLRGASFGETRVNWALERA